MAYAKLIMQAFSDDYEVLSMDDIFEKIDKPKTKMTYVCAALKKLIELNKIEQIVVSGEKRLYAGHYYRLKKIDH